MTRTERRQESDAKAGNRRIAVHQLALELLRQGSCLTMLEAVERAAARVDGGRS